MKSLFVIIFVTLLLASSSHGADWTDLCGSALGKVPTFQQFTLFPNPVQVGQSAFIRTVVSLPDLGAITDGIIKLKIQLNGADVLMLGNISLCNSTSSIACDKLVKGDNALNFDFMVPQIPAGAYTVFVYTTLYPSGSMGCLSFTFTVTDPTQGSVYTSWIQASLAGSAQFENPNVTNRAIGDLMQVGPIGPAPTIVSSTYQWGTFLSVTGSQDTILPYFSPSGYVWGLSGTITQIVYSPTLRNHTYEGSFYVGYVSSSSNRQLDVEILDGNFTITISYEMDSGVVTASSLTGVIYFFNDLASIPNGWSEPITISAFGELTVETSSNGLLMVAGSKDYCLTPGKACSEGSAIVQPANNPSSNSLTTADKGIIAGTIIGFCIVAGLIVALVFWRRHRRHYEEENGIFSATRKPEYGNALVVDDIIQETREHGASPNMIPRLDRHPGDSESEDDYNSEDDESELSRRRDSRFSRDDRRSRSGSRGRRSRTPERRGSRSAPPPDYYSDSYDSEDAGSSASRGSDEE